MVDDGTWHDGDLVEFHFEGTLDNGEVFDSSRGRRARVFVLGRDQLLAAFEAQLRTMAIGERRRFRLEPRDAYGEHDPAWILEAPRAEAPPEARVGDEVPLVGGRPARLVAMTDTTVTLDANHPLAGKALNFEVELLSVQRSADGA